MSGSGEPFWAWPGWTHLRYAGWLTLVVTLWFGLVFGGADWWTAQRSFRVRVHLAAELDWPLIPGFVVFYMSIYLLFLGAPFVLRTRREFRALAVTQTLVIFVAGIGFLLCPAELAFVPEKGSGVWTGPLRFADWLNLTYNLLPSLHVALSVVCLAALAARARAAGQ